MKYLGRRFLKLKLEYHNSQYYTREHFEEYKKEKLKMGEEWDGDYLDYLKMELVFARVLKINHDGTIDKEYERIVKLLTARIAKLESKN